MNRRSFFQVSGATSAGVLLAGAEKTQAEGFPVPIDQTRLAARNANRSTVVCQRGMVCSSQPLASVAGLDVLKQGGSAIDAAICANAVLAVVEPMSCGPGGDLFAILWSEKDEKLFGLNASGRAPHAWDLQAAAKLGIDSIPTYSPLAWSVPGCVSGWGALHERFGKLAWAEVLGASQDYARNGFPVSPIIGRGWLGDAQKKYPTLYQTYAPEGKPPAFGDIFKNPGMADFLELIARGGAEAFYQGEVAERIVKFSRQNGGHFSMRDFQDHTANWVDPVSANYRGFDVWEIPPNGQGIAALQIMNMLQEFDVPALKPNSAEHLHLFLEAKKLAFEDRAVYYADMEFADVPLKQLISRAYGKERAKLIDPKRAAQKVAPGRLTGSSDTVYLTAADQEGNMISLIQSIYHGWGSHYVPDGLGFALQNRGSSFSLNPEDLNRLEPHKRPFHTIIPGFLTREDRPLMPFGVMGGDFQPQGHAQVLMNLIDFGMSPQQAGDQARVQHSESSSPSGFRATGPGTVSFERGIADSVRLELAEMGHRVSGAEGAFGGYQSIWRMDDPLRYFGGSDPAEGRVRHRILAERQGPMQIVLALDKFKGTLTGLQACQGVRAGLTEVFAGAEFILCPIADGGEGTVDALAARLPGERRAVEVENAVGSRRVRASYWIDHSNPVATAYLEMASASGLALLEPAECAPLRATTFGTGQLMRAALEEGASRLVIGMGGSATNDGGSGVARAFGYRFLDAGGRDLESPGDFARLERIEAPEALPAVECLVLADVTNPLLGPEGATAVYGPQKGVTAAQAAVLEAGLARLAEVAARDLGMDRRTVPGSGAAGGCAYGLLTFLGAKLVPGFDFVSECLGLEDAIAAADWVVTGEGRMDGQTLSGKGPVGVAALAKRQGTRVAAVCGAIAEEARADLLRVFPVLRALTEDVSAREAMRKPQEALRQTSRRLGELLAACEARE